MSIRGEIHRSAVRCENAALSCLNLRQLLSLGKRVSSAGAREMIVRGGKDAVRASEGYIPQKHSCKDSSALGNGVERR